MYATYTKAVAFFYFGAKRIYRRARLAAALVWTWANA